MGMQKDADTAIFELVVGLEIHVQLNTATKLFASDSAKALADANTNISVVTLALPGVLPVLNKEVVEKAVTMGLALNCSINQLNAFDRKNYFYADLPKGYQITQDAKPICVNGLISITLADGTQRDVRINRIHLEEDAGKSLHDQHPDFSYVDLNRAGVPLIEIVTEPDIRSAEEAGLILAEIRKLVKYYDIGDGNMEAGNLRCDANISIRPVGASQYGTRCEVKNLNSIKNLRRAIAFEYNRQAELIGRGASVVQSTLNFNAETGETSPMRSKEEANDYRYFPDPDLPPMYISDTWLEEIKLAMPKNPNRLLKDLQLEYGIQEVDAQILVNDPDLLKYFIAGTADNKSVKTFCNLLIGPVRALLIESKIELANWIVSPKQMAAIAQMIDARLITQSSVFQILIPNIKHFEEAPQTIAQKLDLLISNNQVELDELIALVLQKYPSQKEAYIKGKKGVLGLFVGEIMKLSGGKLDPQLVSTKLIEKIENEKN